MIIQHHSADHKLISCLASKVDVNCKATAKHLNAVAKAVASGKIPKEVRVLIRAWRNTEDDWTSFDSIGPAIVSTTQAVSNDFGFSEVTNILGGIPDNICDNTIPGVCMYKRGVITVALVLVPPYIDQNDVDELFHAWRKNLDDNFVAT